MPVNWKQFADDLAAWERTSSHERFLGLCNDLERSIRRAFRRDGLLDFDEVTAALDCIAQEIVRMRRDARGLKPGERVSVELEAVLADRLRRAAARDGLEVGEYLALLADRQLFSPEPAPRARVRVRRKRRGGEE